MDRQRGHERPLSGRPLDALRAGPAAALARAAESIADTVTERLYRERPELIERHGNAGILKCRTDILHNVEYLLPAVELDAPRLFAKYVEWLAPMLAAHGVPGDDVRRSLELMREAVLTELGTDHGATVARHVEVGIAALDDPPS